MWNNKAFQPKNTVLRRSTEFDDGTNTTQNGLKSGYMDSNVTSATNSAQHKVNFDPYLNKNQVYPSPSIMKKNHFTDGVYGLAEPTPPVRRYRGQGPRRKQTIVVDRRSKDRSYDIYTNDDKTGYKTPDSELVEIENYPDYNYKSRETRGARASIERRDRPSVKIQRSPKYKERYGYFSDDSRYSDYDRQRRQKRKDDKIDDVLDKNASFIQREIERAVQDRFRRQK